GGTGPAADWLVHMRRLPAGALLDRAIRAGTLTDHEVRRFATVLSSFYLACEPVDIGATRYRSGFEREIAGNRAALHDGRYGVPDDRATAPFDAQLQFLRANGALLDAR